MNNTQDKILIKYPIVKYSTYFLVFVPGTILLTYNFVVQIVEEGSEEWFLEMLMFIILLTAIWFSYKVASAYFRFIKRYFFKKYRDSILLNEDSVSVPRNLTFGYSPSGEHLDIRYKDIKEIYLEIDKNFGLLKLDKLYIYYTGNKVYQLTSDELSRKELENLSNYLSSKGVEMKQDKIIRWL